MDTSNRDDMDLELPDLGGMSRVFVYFHFLILNSFYRLIFVNFVATFF